MRRILIFLLAISPLARGQDLGPGARGSVFRAAMVAAADDHSAAYWNPAGMLSMGELTFGASVRRMPHDRDLGLAAFCWPMSERDRLGAGWLGLFTGDIEARLGNTPMPDYIFDSREQALFLSYARKLPYRLALGASIKLQRNNIDMETGTGWGVDLGLAYAPRPDMTLGMTVRDVGSRVRWSTGHEDRPGMAGCLGAAYRTGDMLFAVGVETDESLQEVLPSAGLELGVSGTFFLRAGWRDGELALGLGIRLDREESRITVGYATATGRVGDGMSHVCDINLELKGREKARKPERGQAQEGRGRKRNILVIVLADRLRVRMGPGTEYRVMGLVDRGQVFPYLGEKNGWLSIQYKGRIGWVGGSYARVIRR